MSVCIHTGALYGVEGVPVRVEVDLLRRLPSVVIVGLAGCAVRESAERVRSAIQSSAAEFPRTRVVINLAPASLPKAGTAFDLPIAVAVLAESGQVPPEALDDTFFFGELSLQGELRPVEGALAMALCARANGKRRIVLPQGCAGEAAVLSDISVLAARDLREVIAWLDGRGTLPVASVAPPVEVTETMDLREVRGQARARRALEIAAAGGHNLLMVGSPGCGKTMLAARLPTILPDLAFDEAVELTTIHSAAGLLKPGQGLLCQRPFRSPHHTISSAGLVGGASLRPGEVSLAHQGVLFLDELPEFQHHVLEMLRGPMEDRAITLTRNAGTVRLPASFSLVAAANPCPCGYAGHPTRPCTCAPAQVDRYRGRMSGPLLDRVDLQVWVQPVDARTLVSGAPGEDSQTVRARVMTARNRARRRYGPGGPRCNAELSGDAILSAARPTEPARRLLGELVERYALSGRAWSRIIKVARTIADLEGADVVDATQVMEASGYRVDTLEAAP